MKLDTILRNARVVDGKGNPEFPADIGLRGGRIHRIAPKLADGSPNEIDCAGRVVVPGFIDAHSHADLALLAQGLEHEKLRMGVTTEIIGQCGYSAFPVSDLYRRLRARTFAGFLPGVELAWNWSSLEDVRSECQRAGLTHNVVPLVGHGSVRMAVMGDRPQAPSAAELDRMQELVRQAMQEGCFGLSSGLIYPPACYAETNEIESLCRVAGDFGGHYVTHVRGETARLIDGALDEAIAISSRSGMPLHISHLKVIGNTPASRGKIGSVIGRLEAAVDNRLQVTFDCYPYTEGSTLLSALLPRWAHAEGVDTLMRNLRDLSARIRIRNDIEADRGDWENWLLACGFAAVKIGSIRRASNQGLAGKDLLTIAQERGTDPIEALFDILSEEAAGAIMVFSMMSEEDMLKPLVHPLGMIGTDAIPCPVGSGRPHPRGYGAFPRILGRYVRQAHKLSLEAAVHKMTGFPAQVFGIQDRGRVEEGMAADLVVIDPEEICDRATYEEPRLAPEGVHTVFVNGRLAVTEGRVTGERAGAFLSRPPVKIPI
jgi:N-acyl-D-amino-acid deacylase